MKFVDFCDAVGFTLTAGQRVLCKVAFDRVDHIDLPADEREIAAELFGPVDRIPASARSTLAIVAGRGSGKTQLGALYLLWRALTADLSALAPGELAYAISVAPDRDLAGITLAFARGALESSRFAAVIESVTADALILRRADGRRVSVEVFAASVGGRSVRGKTIVAAELGECAFFGDASKVVNAGDLFRAVVPRLVPGGMIVCSSTPWLRSGLLWDLFEANFAQPTAALVAHAPTLALRGDDPDVRAMVEREYERDPDNARRELGAEWLAVGAGNLFDSAALEAAIVENVERASRGTISIGGDFGLVNDPTAFVVVQRDAVTSRLIVLEVVELKPSRGKPVELETVVRRADDLCRQYGVRKVRVDHHSLTQAREWATKLRARVVFEPASEGTARQLRFQRAADAVKRGMLVIPRAHSDLAEQLGSLVATPRAGGGYAYDAPRRSGNHCDSAMALLLAAEPLLNFDRYIEGLRKMADNPQRAATRMALLTGNSPQVIQRERGFCRGCGYPARSSLCRC